MANNTKFTDEELDNMSRDEKIAYNICPECHSKLFNIGGCKECRNDECSFFGVCE